MKVSTLRLPFSLRGPWPRASGDGGMEGVEGLGPFIIYFIYFIIILRNFQYKIINNKYIRPKAQVPIPFPLNSLALLLPFL